MQESLRQEIIEKWQGRGKEIGLWGAQARYNKVLFEVKKPAEILTSLKADYEKYADLACSLFIKEAIEDAENLLKVGAGK